MYQNNRARSSTASLNKLFNSTSIKELLNLSRNLQWSLCRYVILNSTNSFYMLLVEFYCKFSIFVYSVMYTSSMRSNSPIHYLLTYLGRWNTVQKEWLSYTWNDANLKTKHIDSPGLWANALSHFATKHVTACCLTPNRNKNRTKNQVLDQRKNAGFYDRGIHKLHPSVTPPVSAKLESLRN